jgi:uncharacterized OsmC-like protein
MVRILATYQGEKHCELLHVPSKSRLETDAPVDNQGKGERFSPTDLVGSALVSCILTTMAIVAERDNVSIVGAEAEVEKVMSNNPRRIASLHVKIKLSKKIRRLPKKTRKHCTPVSGTQEFAS